MNDKTKAILIIFIGSLIAGAVSPVTKIGLIRIPPFSFSFIRFLISSICLLPFFFNSKIKINEDFRNLLLISLLPILNIALFVLGVKVTTASIAQMLYAATPILTGISAFYLFKDRMQAKKWLSIVIGLIGVALVIFLPLIQKNSLYSGNLQGNILISLGVIVYSIYVVLSKKYQKIYSPLFITSVFIFLGTIVFLLLSLWELKTSSDWLFQLKTQSVYAILYVSIFGTVLSYLLGQYAIKFGGPVLASLAFYLQPIFAYGVSYMLLGEQLTVGLLVGTILVFISIALTTYAK